MTDHAFDDGAIARLRLAAEEVAWLTGRGYPLDVVGDLVARHHGLDDAQRSALAHGTCSEPQYRRRAARELEAEDVARRPLAIDAVDTLAAVEAALAGAPILQTLDGTMRAFGVDRAEWAPGARADDAIDRVLAAVKDLRPQVVRFVVEESAPNSALVKERVLARAASHHKALKGKVDVVVAADRRAALRKERHVVTADAEVLDACAAWLNLTARVVEGVPGAAIVRLQ